MSGSGSACMVDEDGSDHARPDHNLFRDQRRRPVGTDHRERLRQRLPSWSYSASGSYRYSPTREGTATYTTDSPPTAWPTVIDHRRLHARFPGGGMRPAAAAGRQTAAGLIRAAADHDVGNSHYDYSDTVDLAIVADGWNFTARLKAATTTPAIPTRTTFSLPKAPVGRLAAPAPEWMVRRLVLPGEGEYWSTSSAATVSGGFATNVDHMIYTFDTNLRRWRVERDGSATVTDLLNSD